MIYPQNTITQDEYDALKITLAARDAEIKRLRGILKRVTPDPVWGEDPKVTAFYKEARAALQPKEQDQCPTTTIQAS